MSRYECRQAGCDRGPSTGHALYRTSPKGELFEGACEDHFDGEADPIARAIEDRNLGRTRPAAEVVVPDTTPADNGEAV